MESRRFEGRLAVVTASTDGIGYAIAEKLAKEGAKVIVSSRRAENVERAERQLMEQGLAVKGVVCHVGDPTALQYLVREAVAFGDGAIDILVSNAAVSPVMATLSQTPESALDTIWKTNVKSAILLIQKALPHLSKDASIVLNISIAAYRAETMPSMYAVSKTALLGVVKAFANELGRRGIRVNGVAPGIVPTRLSKALTEQPALRGAFLKGTSLRRFGKTEEIANVVAFLASKDAAYITGETIVVAGGMQSRL